MAFPPRGSWGLPGGLGGGGKSAPSAAEGREIVCAQRSPFLRRPALDATRQRLKKDRLSPARLYLFRAGISGVSARETALAAAVRLARGHGPGIYPRRQSSFCQAWKVLSFVLCRAT